MTEVEPEWDDSQRDLMDTLAAYERGICACGFHETLAHDTGNEFGVETEVCPLCASLEREARMQGDRDDKARDRVRKPDKSLPADRRDPADGRRQFVRFKGRVQSTQNRTDAASDSSNA